MNQTSPNARKRGSTYCFKMKKNKYDFEEAVINSTQKERNR